MQIQTWKLFFLFWKLVFVLRSLCVFSERRSCLPQPSMNLLCPTTLGQALIYAGLWKIRYDIFTDYN